MFNDSQLIYVLLGLVVLLILVVGGIIRYLYRYRESNDDTMLINDIVNEKLFEYARYMLPLSKEKIRSSITKSLPLSTLAFRYSYSLGLIEEIVDAIATYKDPALRRFYWRDNVEFRYDVNRLYSDYWKVEEFSKEDLWKFISDDGELDKIIYFVSNIFQENGYNIAFPNSRIEEIQKAYDHDTDTLDYNLIIQIIGE